MGAESSEPTQLDPTCRSASTIANWVGFGASAEFTCRAVGATHSKRRPSFAGEARPPMGFEHEYAATSLMQPKA